MDAGAHHHAPFATARSAAGTSAPTGAKMMAASSSSGGSSVRASGPRGAQLAREALALLVAIPGKREDLPALVQSYLDDYVGGGAEAVEAEAFGVAGHPQGAVADQARAQKRRGLQVRVVFGDQEAEAVVGYRVCSA